ncbi:two-component system LytT family sensor kinase [Pedobacter sp. W3I1]|uniref:sensor histidine kinase n=1 Tax=Pedobacter sp. W3I1 TaxID=3042291 RepID=UPI0027871A04|nr:sensor histidine kinase [Pedobacter sp. W3I1]MDQ0640186.1 two-component system LytT family sensor kinase [Pedobacter sp. W3I1]
MKIILSFIKRYRIHFIGWLLFVPTEILIITVATGKFGDIDSYLVHYSLNIALFYFCAHWAYPWIFGKKFCWLWKLPVIGGLTFLCYLVLNYFIDTHIINAPSWKTIQQIEMGYRYVFGVLWRSLMFIGNAGFYYLFLQHLKEIRAREAAEKAKFDLQLAEREMEAKLQHSHNSYLKAQINPHLLFNTLSFIYGDIIATSPRAAEAVITLSNLMRYSIDSEFKAATLPLGEEIEQVKNLISLHRSRFEQELYLEFKVGDGVEKINFIPLVLITIAENIFKHGIIFDANHPAMLQIEYDGEFLKITSRNLPDRKSRPISMNKGLDNIRQRLKIAYGKDAEMDCVINPDFFELKILVRLGP